MSAVPKKKLCWNCEGNVSHQADNCPYCAVYLHGPDDEEEAALWNPSFQSSDKTEEIPAPIYQIQDAAEEGKKKMAQPAAPSLELLNSLKRDVFPILFLMMGSLFFLFGTVLLLFAQNGTLTLQWNGSQAIYFLGCSIPLVLLGSWFLRKSE